MAVGRDVTKKSRPNRDHAERVYSSADQLTLAGPNFTLDFLVPSRLMSPGPPSMGLVLLFLHRAEFEGTS